MCKNVRRIQMIKENILVFLLAVWLMIPPLKEIRITCAFVLKYEYLFILIIGAIGGFFLSFDVYRNFKTRKDKKEYLKEIVPIIVLLGFMLWTLISSIFSVNIKNSFLGSEYRKDGYITYLAYAGFFACAFLIKSKKMKKELIDVFLAMAILNILIVELYNKGIFTNIFAVREINRTCFFNTNHYGYYLLLATVNANFLFITEEEKNKKMLYLSSYAFLLYYLIFNNTFGCYIAFALTLIIFMIYCLYNKKKRFVTSVSIIIFVLMSLISPHVKNIIKKNVDVMFKDIKNIVIAEKVKNDSDIKDKEKIIQNAEQGGSGRIKIWKYGIKFWSERPILGYGPDNLESKYKEVGINQDRPHNLLIQLMTTSGIPGLITYTIAIGIILLKGLKTLKIQNSIHVIVFSNVIAYLISAMFGNSMYYTSPYFFIFLGFLMKENIGKIIIQKEK